MVHVVQFIGPIINKCGGALISDRHVLIAAHCILVPSKTEFKLKSKILVHVGADNLDECGKNISVTKLIIHPEYDSELYNDDIAILKLKRPLKFARNRMPICLPTKDRTKFEDLIVAGWGWIDSSGKRSRHLLTTDIKETDFDYCNKQWNNTLTDKQFCAADYGKDACEGDSGGPVMYAENGRDYAVGVVSFGDICGENQITVHTRVAPYLDFIHQATADGKTCKNKRIRKPLNIKTNRKIKRRSRS
ncbi:venom protease-like protein [Dinothrombium tinctorium]|uniref:Venom protease-like protein n=1 Tax=Dinothrombium tinctorium TaxID=1965070 RepID=A0A3S3P4R4_9ACAR|nr:venom protease-like protein [Dinothrombium tinctorium]